MFILIETLSVREAREQLPTVLERFRQGDRTPVGVGSHRKTEAAMVSVEVFDELTAEQNQSSAQAAASVRAEGLAVSSAAEAIMHQWARGELSTARMRELIRQLHAA
ncbi:antitoxin VbhA family protein [Dactylosporangium matsuzakiense]|uniref:antitoxin VbhA family protein n=1 Tax=Dactylosporangium matsuzakiense TaxID=53360 RepID=UPI0021C2D604|nr:antitoxin VbhA family protein [Dactylosporangium matsuzakiense]UWZ45278.1 antitoxin VbhA family protein [Dactylosporangium matsuzakiense]